MSENKFNWRTIFQAHSGGFSSKRVFGALGMLICLGILVAAFIMERSIPDFAELVYVTSASLLGLDNVTDIFKKSLTENKN
jgi:hypothetical protein